MPFLFKIMVSLNCNSPFECFLKYHNVGVFKSLQHLDLTVGGLFDDFVLVGAFLKLLNGDYTGSIIV